MAAESNERIEALGQSDAFLAFQERLSRVARVDRPVLVVGERGVGKELAAARIHYLSPRWSAPLVTLDCAALAPSLIESELFGYEPGAFTGAARAGRTGRFEAADGGTLFLDEIGNVPIEAQEKILRVVEYGVFERVGGSTPVSVDVRITGATNADLPALVDAGRFMRDLLDRLSFEVLVAPPLRERSGDILLLATHFAAAMARELGLEKTPEFSEDVLVALEEYDWPGNVRELKNVVERAVYRAEGRVVDEVVFDPFAEAAAGQRLTGRTTATPASDHDAPPVDTSATLATETAEAVAAPEAFPMPGETDDLREAVRDYEVVHLRAALKRSRYNQRAAAEALGLTYDQFRGMYRKYAEQLDDAP